MTTEFDTLRSRLESERKRLLAELAQLKPAEERPEGSPFGKREEGATEALELEKRLALENQVREVLGEVEQALRKFEEGTYGLCDGCRQPIGLDRLEAIPQARFCLSCKAKQAKNAKSKHTPT